jgi:hypothetical protein
MSRSKPRKSAKGPIGQTPNPSVLKICVIGAGSSGLVTVKELREAGHQVVCYEKKSEIGGVFAHSATKHTNGSNPYIKPDLTSSNYSMAFSSFPPSEASKQYWTPLQYGRYLERFAKAYGLLDFIQFETDVLRVRQRDGMWEIQVQVQGAIRSELYDAVAVCVGRYASYKIPAVPGLEQYTGTALHSSKLTELGDFRGKRVVCVGLGESGADICHQLSYVAAQISVIVNRPPHVTHRNLLPHTGREDTHDAIFSPFLGALESRRYDEHHVQVLMQHQARFLLGKMIPTIVDLEARLVREWELMRGGFPGGALTNSDGFLKDLISGRTGINLFGVESISDHYITCGDGAIIPCDAIIFCTGYADLFPFFCDDPRITEAQRNPRQLFKHMIHAEIGSTLSFIGFARPIAGGIPMVAELQARYFAMLCSNKRRVCTTELVATIESDARKEDAYFYVQRNMPSLIVQADYRKWMAKEIGCWPTVTFWMRHPRLWRKYYFTATNAFLFRLVGPGRMVEQASDILMRQTPPMGFAGTLIVLILIVWLRVHVMLDKVFSHSLSLKIEREGRAIQPLTTFLSAHLFKKRFDESSIVRLCCDSDLQWQNLKYKIASHYKLNAKRLQNHLTVRELRVLIVESCTENVPT